MENSNSIGLNIDLNTETGKAIFAAVAAVVLGSSTAVVKTPEAKVVKMPAATIPAAPSAPVAVPNLPITPSIVPTAPSIPAAPSAPVAPTLPPVAPSAPKAPVAPTLPPVAPSAPKAPAPAKEPKAPKAPVVDFASLDEDGKREAIKKVTTKWSKKGKTTDIKALAAAYGATNVETVDAAYLDHFNWAINQFDTNGQDMAAVLATFGAQ